MYAVGAPRRSTFFEDVLLETLNACLQILVAPRSPSGSYE